MGNPIEAILFYFRGTLRKTIKRDEPGRREQVRKIEEMLGCRLARQGRKTHASIFRIC